MRWVAAGIKEMAAVAMSICVIYVGRAVPRMFRWEHAAVAGRAMTQLIQVGDRSSCGWGLAHANWTGARGSHRWGLAPLHFYRSFETLPAGRRLVRQGGDYCIWR